MTENHTKVWKARGKCGGPFQKGSRHVLFGGEDAKGLFIYATQIAEDARAPCYDHDEKFYACPIALSASKMSQAAYRWRAKAERGMLGTLGESCELTAVCAAAIDEAHVAIDERKTWDLDELDRKRKKRKGKI